MSQTVRQSISKRYCDIERLQSKIEFMSQLQNMNDLKKIRQ